MTELEELKLQLDAANKRITELDIENTRLGSVLVKIAYVLGIKSKETKPLKDKVLASFHKAQKTQEDDSVFETLKLVHIKLDTIEDLWNYVITGEIPIKIITGRNPIGSLQASKESFPKVTLNIECRYVDGQLQIAYFRDKDGSEHAFNQNGGHVAFYINVEIDEYLLKQTPPIVLGKIQT